MIVSYAQNGEDVVLNRALSGVEAGFYIDIGASDPVVDSVTKLFYERGWSGLNVEPAQIAYAALREFRDRDINLDVGVGDSAGEVSFYELPLELSGCSSFSGKVIDDYRGSGWEVQERTVEVVTLASICDRWVGERAIQFLKVDVEGSEEAVLDGADFERFRPRIVIVEATRPGTNVPSFERWEPKLLRHGYLFALFDGLNRFYVRDEDRDLIPVIASPASVLDDFETYPVVKLREEASLLREDASHARGLAEELGREVQSARESLEEARSALVRSNAELSDVRRERDAARRALLEDLSTT